MTVCFKKSSGYLPSTGWAFANLRSPMGGFANGIPRKTWVSDMLVCTLFPATLPVVVTTSGLFKSTVGGEIVVSGWKITNFKALRENRCLPMFKPHVWLNVPHKSQLFGSRKKNQVVSTYEIPIISVIKNKNKVRCEWVVTNFFSNFFLDVVKGLL